MTMAISAGCGGVEEVDREPAGPLGELSVPCPTTDTGIVRLHVASSRGTYLVHDAAGALFDELVTATPGDYELEVPACGSVTSVDPTRTHYETTTHLLDGDELYSFVDARYVGVPSAASVVIGSPIAGATSYVATGGDSCSGQGSSTISMGYTPPCVGPDGRGTILIQPAGAMFAYAVFDDVKFADTTSVPLRVTTWQVDAPAHLVELDLATAPSTATCDASSLRGLVTYAGRSATVDQPPANTSLALRFAELGDGHELSCAVELDGTSRSLTRRTAGPMPEAVALNDADFLPRIVSTHHAIHPTRPTVAFDANPGMADEDLVRVTIRGRAAAGYADVTWQVLAPGGTREVRLPEVPAELSVSFPKILPFDIALFDATTIDGYREALLDTTRLLAPPPNRPLGTLRVSTWSP